MRISDWSSDVCSSDLKATSADRIALEWKIADGYYLYRHRTKAVAADGSRLGELDLPRGEPHEDEFFGHVETFRQRLARSEEHTSELQSLMRISYAVFCLKKKNRKNHTHTHHKYTQNSQRNNNSQKRP